MTHSNIFPFISTYSFLGNPVDRGASLTTVHGVTKNQTRLSDQHLFMYSVSNEY